MVCVKLEMRKLGEFSQVLGRGVGSKLQTADFTYIARARGAVDCTGSLRRLCY